MRARHHRVAQRQIGGSFEPCARGVRGAEFLQPCGLSTSGAFRFRAPARVAEHAGAEAVHQIDRALLDELPRNASGPLANKG